MPGALRGRGLLLIGEPPRRSAPTCCRATTTTSTTIPLFWANLRADVARRRGGMEAGQRRLITGDAAELPRDAARGRASAGARPRHQDDRHRDSATRAGASPRPASRSAARKFTRRQGGAGRDDRAERGVRGLVIGLPLNMDGSEGPRAQSTPRLRPQPGRPGPADPAVGRALVDRRGRARADRAGHEPRQARRTDRFSGRRDDPPGRDRCADRGNGECLETSRLIPNHGALPLDGGGIPKLGGSPPSAGWVGVSAIAQRLVHRPHPTATRLLRNQVFVSFPHRGGRRT